jgi:glutathione S-transferase
MKLYYHPASRTSRPLSMLVAEHGRDVDRQVVDLFAAEHRGEACAALNAICLAPTLQDGASGITESSTILKYLADEACSPLSPTELQARALVNERVDWIEAMLDKGWSLYVSKLDSRTTACRAQQAC